MRVAPLRRLARVSSFDCKMPCASDGHVIVRQQGIDEQQHFDENGIAPAIFKLVDLMAVS